MKTVVVAETKDWDLVVYTNYFGYRLSIPPGVETEVLNETWKHQDGYGSPGYTPCQGWDWSGVRDSSEYAKRNMAEAIRKVLGRHGITSFEVEKRW